MWGIPLIGALALQSHAVYGFCEGIYQSVALHLTTSMGLFSVDGIDRSVSVTIGVYKPCIDQGIDFYTWHRAVFAPK